MSGEGNGPSGEGSSQQKGARERLGSLSSGRRFTPNIKTSSGQRNQAGTTVEEKSESVSATRLNELERRAQRDEMAQRKPVKKEVKPEPSQAAFASNFEGIGLGPSASHQQQTPKGQATGDNKPSVAKASSRGKTTAKAERPQRHSGIEVKDEPMEPSQQRKLVPSLSEEWLDPNQRFPILLGDRSGSKGKEGREQGGVWEGLVDKPEADASQEADLALVQLPSELPLASGMGEAEGTVGELRKHRSGRVTMKVGEQVLEVREGSDGDHAEELARVQFAERGKEEGSEEKPGELALLGRVTRRFVAIPDVGTCNDDNDLDDE